MLSAIGLAFALVIGLFRHAEPLAPGFARDPAEVAHDASFGLVGATLLASGFVLQSLSYFGVAVECSTKATLAAAVATLLGATLFAWLAYGASYLVVFGHERRRALREWGMAFATRRERRGLRFWNQVPVRPPPPAQ